MYAAPDSSLASMQSAFAARIRDPDATPCPEGVPIDRMAVYEELFYNNIHGVLSDVFPVLRSLHTEEQWHTICHDFFARHRCQTPLFNRVAAEFLDYLSNSADKPVFMLELAHYEWLELELAFNEAELPEADPELDDAALLEASYRLSPLVLAVTYNYPVQAIAPDNIPDAPQPVQLLVYRDRGDRIGFLQLNPVSARLLQLIEENKESDLRSMLERIATELNHPNPDTVIQGGTALLREFIQRDILLLQEAS